MKVLGMFLLSFLLQSCNQPFSIARHDLDSDRPSKKADPAPSSGSYQRFLPVNGNPQYALDTVTGQLCKTYPILSTNKADDLKALSLPFCRDLWMASNMPTMPVDNSGQAQQQGKDK